MAKFPLYKNRFHVEISFVTVKEQCIVLFPYNAVNEDELSLEEGQLITIVSKDVEDKGWWKGEVDGKVGVFPVSFELFAKNGFNQRVKRDNTYIRECT